MRKIMSLAALGLAASACAASPAAEPAPQSGGETVIPFISSIRSVEWKAASDESLYVRGGDGSWYFIRTTNRCTRLRAASGIGFDTSALNQLDRYGAILVEGQRCPVASITRSDPPPRKSRRT
jgi:hypothetical protein